MATKKLTPDGEIILADEMIPNEYKPFWKTPFNHDTDAEATRTALYCFDDSKAQQHGKEEADINTLVDRFLKTGQMPSVSVPPRYGDFNSTADYHDLQNHLAETNALFYRLPAAVRASYQNDPAQWIGDVNERLANGTPADLDALRAMGMDIPATAPPEAPKEPNPKGGTTPGAPAPEPPKTEPPAP